MIIEQVPVAQITNADYNPRVDLKPGDPEYDALVQSVGKWGMVQPLVWNKRSGRLVAGHQRLKVLLASGATEVTCTVLDLSDADERALSVALNKISGKWDAAKLYDVLTELPDGLLGLTGFEPDALAALAKDVESLVPFAPELTPVVGDRQVTQAQVQAAATKEAGRFEQTAANASAQVVDLTCPFCGGVFGVTQTALGTETGKSKRRIHG